MSRLITARSLLFAARSAPNRGISSAGWHWHLHNNSAFGSIVHWQSFSSRPNPDSKEKEDEFNENLPARELHELRHAQARALREERRRLHEEKMKQAQLDREVRSQRHAQRVQQEQEVSFAARTSQMRKDAAKSVAHVLGKDPQYFAWTMDHLNLSLVGGVLERDGTVTSKNSHDKSKGESGLSGEYRVLFLSSVKSFMELLMESPEKLTALYKDGEEGRVDVVKLLDELVDGGFADLQFAKKLRKMNDYVSRLESKYTKELRSRAKTLGEKMEVMKEEETKVEKLEQKLRELLLPRNAVERSDKLESKEDTMADFGGTLDGANTARHSLLPEYKGDEDGEELSDEVRPEEPEEISSARAGLKQKRKAVKNAREKVKQATHQMRQTIKIRDSFRPQISQEQYEEASKIISSVVKRLCPVFARHINQRNANMVEQFRTLDNKTDLTKPHEWYLHARLDRRKIILHGGPTNSGKTYHALQSLRKAQKGLYLGPLRLLAWEVYETLTSQGVLCNLYTGQERREIPFSTHASATVEMAPTDEDFDVVVIDEIQMIADPDRGHAWTRALLGLRCKEIHLCGGLESSNIIRKLCEMCGDEFELRNYERFSELSVAEESLSPRSGLTGSYAKVQPGDCVVAFSRNDIFAIKREIEKRTKYKCCVIYGSLPPATRTDQARKFNDPNSGYDVLVASDAIGMGLNLNIRRVIFNSMFKSNGEQVVRLGHSAVKQIGGRAGRRNSPFPVGEVTCRDPLDMEYLKSCMTTEINPIENAGLLPTGRHIEAFSEALETHKLSSEYDNLHKVLHQFSDMATLKGDFFLCRLTEIRNIAKRLNNIPLSLTDKYTLCMAPVPTRCQRTMTTLKKFAEKHSIGQASGLRRTMLPKPAKSFDDLSHLCAIHNELELFLWLQRRFPGNVVEEHAGIALKERVINFINEGIGVSDKLKLEHCYIQRDTKIRSRWKRIEEQGREDDEFDVSSIDQLDDLVLQTNHLEDL